MSLLDDLDAAIDMTVRPSPAPHRTRIYDLLRRIIRGLQEWRDTLEEWRGQAVAKFQQLDSRLDAVEAVPAVRLTVVASVAELPAEAGPRDWFRVQGDPAVYVGNGAGQPLRRIVTSVV